MEKFYSFLYSFIRRVRAEVSSLKWAICITEKEGLKDYNRINISYLDFIFMSLCSLGFSVFMGYFFYGSMLGLLITWPSGVVLFGVWCGNRRKKQRSKLLCQFKECILSVAVLVRSGFSLENAFLETLKESEYLYGPSAPICVELLAMKNGLSMNKNIETLLSEFAGRSGSLEILEFADVVSAGKRGGADMAELIENTAELISNRVDALEEMKAVLGGRKMEMMIMRFMPFVMTGYIELSNKGYFNSLYKNTTGVFVMTGCLAAYGLSFFLSEKILKRIEDEVR